MFSTQGSAALLLIAACNEVPLDMNALRCFVIMPLTLRSSAATYRSSHRLLYIAHSLRLPSTRHPSTVRSPATWLDPPYEDLELCRCETMQALIYDLNVDGMREQTVRQMTSKSLPSSHRTSFDVCGGYSDDHRKANTPPHFSTDRNSIGPSPTVS